MRLDVRTRNLLTYYQQQRTSYLPTQPTFFFFSTVFPRRKLRCTPVACTSSKLLRIHEAALIQVDNYLL